MPKQPKQWTGRGHLEIPGGDRIPVEYNILSYREPAETALDNYGQLRSDDPELFTELLIQYRDPTFVLTDKDGTHLTITLTSVSGAVRLQGVPVPAHA